MPSHDGSSRQPALPTIGVAILHMGDRPRELRAALDSLSRQQDVELDVVLVGNGWEPVGLPDWVRTVHLPTNVGIPEGRNVAARAVRGKFIYFLDDDAVLPEPDVLARLAAVITSDPTVAVAQPRGTDPHGLPTPRRWVPRLITRGGGTAGPATWFWEAAFMIRRTAFEQVGGWPGSFFFGHESIDLSWRLIDAGWQIEYVPSIRIHHPATEVTRHAVYYRLNARNRVWVARRNLPASLVPVYLAVWTVATVVRVHDLRGLRTWFDGFAEGLRTDPGPRRPMSWRTVLLLTRLGRPPAF